MGTEAPAKLTGIKPALKPVNIIEINIPSKKGNKNTCKS